MQDLLIRIPKIPMVDNSPKYFYMTQREQDSWKRVGVLPDSAEFDVDYGGLVMKEVKHIDILN